MPIKWKLRSYLADKHGVFNATALKRRIEEQTGVVISLSNIHTYFAKKPVQLKLTTVELMCTTFGCVLSDFLEVTPGRRSSTRRKLSFKNTPPKNRIKKNAFPDPKDYAHI